VATMTSIKLEDVPKRDVPHLAETRRCTSHWIIRDATTEYVDRVALRRGTLDAREKFQATGLHATAEDVQS